MRGLWRIGAVLAALSLWACQGEIPGDPTKPTTPPKDPYAACTDPNTCCCTAADPNCAPENRLDCVGDPDKGVVCTCRGLWDCSKNPKKCEQGAPIPPGGGDWDCTWTEFKYTCTKKLPPGTPPGQNPQDLPGGGGWACTWKDTEFKWECTREPPNPSNKPQGTGAWKCVVQDGKLICDRIDTPTEPPPGTGKWNCQTDAKTGKTICTSETPGGGLPPGGSDWKCNKTMKNGVPTWVCYGKGSDNNPPGGGGWTCTKVDEFGTWKCEKPEDTSDYPPGGGWYSCVKGSEFNGTQCEKVPTEPTPPTPTPKPGDKCIVGEKMWCDGLQYCGWGQVMCDPKTGKWTTKLDANGKEILDCNELATGERPNTVCACFHFFFNPSCCERPDCIVPPGTNGQICPQSKGGLCDYCNPQKSECKEPQAKCIVTNAHETFCGKLCGPTAPCPAGYQCMVVKLNGGQTTNQCVPADYSCYY
ncbi:MAG: hypothetical protein ACOY3Y_02460 [Acidobacteriota bacterium]